MKHHRISRDTQVLERLAALIRLASEQHRQQDQEIPSIGFAMDEAIKEAMRRFAQEHSGFRDPHELLRVAIDDTTERLNAAIGQQGLRFDWEQYLEEASNSLKGVAKEIHRLSGKLRESKTAKRVYDRERSARADEEVVGTPLFEIRELGLLDSIEGLLAIPSAVSGTIDIDAIREGFQVTGDWFPYEVGVGELVYVVDDDGSVLVSTENFPKELVERARQTLEDIATHLYS